MKIRLRTECAATYLPLYILLPFVIISKRSRSVEQNVIKIIRRIDAAGVHIILSYRLLLVTNGRFQSLLAKPVGLT
jgi:hypothetical protein